MLPSHILFFSLISSPAQPFYSCNTSCSPVNWAQELPSGEPENPYHACQTKEGHALLVTPPAHMFQRVIHVYEGGDQSIYPTKKKRS